MSNFKNWFFSADLHLKHKNIIKYCNRPFLSQKEQEELIQLNKKGLSIKDLNISDDTVEIMTDTIIDNINAVVKKQDYFVIVGDFCMLPRGANIFKAARDLRDRINCDNLYLIFGNHDNYKALRPLFIEIYDQYMFEINNQSIFCNHYPMRSWEKSHHGSWNLYGHVHNQLWAEDNGGFLPHEESIYNSGLKQLLEKHNIYTESLQNDIMNLFKSTKGTSLCLDVGVDNFVEGIPFGTPWSFDRIKAYMETKKNKWQEKQNIIKKTFNAKGF